jgi:hypothetical protein
MQRGAETRPSYLVPFASSECLIDGTTTYPRALRATPRYRRRFYEPRPPPSPFGESGRGGTASEGRERRDKCYRGSPLPPVVPPAEGGFPEGAGVSTRLLPGFFGGPKSGRKLGRPLLSPLGTRRRFYGRGVVRTEGKAPLECLIDAFVRRTMPRSAGPSDGGIHSLGAEPSKKCPYPPSRYPALRHRLRR